MKLVDANVSMGELREMAAGRFGDLVKAVVDVKRGVMVVDADLNSDEEAFLLESGSMQPDLWGINLYPGMPDADWIEFDSVINIRPSQGNRSRSVDDPFGPDHRRGRPARHSMSALHHELTVERWQSFSLVEQLANVGSEVERAINWSKKGKPEVSMNALYRGLELLDLTIADPRHRGRGRLKELTRLREALLDYFAGPNEFGSSDAAWHRYFHAFGTAAALERERSRAS